MVVDTAGSDVVELEADDSGTVVVVVDVAETEVLTGSVVVESIFGIPGIGRYFVVGALGRDYPLVMGTVITVAVAVILSNLIVDFILGLLDPRVRYASRPR